MKALIFFQNKDLVPYYNNHVYQFFDKFILQWLRLSIIDYILFNRLVQLCTFYDKTIHMQINSSKLWHYHSHFVSKASSTSILLKDV